MKKSSLLSLLTAAAIVTTSAGTFAVWDTTTGSKTGTLQIDKKIEVVATGLDTFTGSLTTVSDTAATYESTVSFAVNGNDANRASTIKLTPSIKNSADVDITNNFTVEFSQTGTDNGLSGMIDSKITETNEYIVKVTPLNTDYAGEAIKVTVTGLLS